MARCLAAAINQAPGLEGTPDSGHCSSAATRASCARSSARPTSRTIRVRPAMSLADSILQTASIARCVSVAVTATNQCTNATIAQVKSSPGQCCDIGRGERVTEERQSDPELAGDRAAEIAGQQNCSEGSGSWNHVEHNADEQDRPDHGSE